MNLRLVGAASARRGANVHRLAIVVAALLCAFVASARASAAVGGAAASALTAGPVAAYNFDDGVGATLRDLSGNGNDGSVSGAAWTSGHVGGALSFNGGSDRVTIADAGELDLSTAMTLEAWVSPSQVNPAWRAVIAKQGAVLAYGLFAGTDTFGPAAQVAVPDAATAITSNRIPKSEWTHLAATYDGATLRLYVNGTEAATSPATGAISASIDPLRIGGGPNSTDSFKGLVDDVRIYSRALSPAEINADMQTPVTAPPADTQPPTSPSGVVASNVSQTSVTLSWNAAQDDVGVTGYGVYLDGTSLGSTTDTSYDVTGLDCGTTYTFAVDAFDAASNRSAPASRDVTTAACPDTQAPSAPTGLAARAATQTSITVSWNAATDNVGVTGYGTYQNGSPVTNSTGTSYTFTGLTCGTSFTLAVDAFDAAGNRSAQSSINASTSACTLDTQAPSAPPNERFAGVTPTTLTLAWDPSTDNVGVAGYNLFLNNVKVATTTQTSYTYAGLTCGTTYTVSVQAFDAAGNASDRAYSTGTHATSACPTNDTQPPSVPPNEHYTGATQTSITLAWDPSTDNVGVAGYSMFLNNVKVATTTQTSYTYAGLTCGTTYTISVQAFDAAGNGSDRAYSTGTSSTTPCTQSTDTQAPTTPAALAMTSATTTSIAVAWGASVDNVGVVGYGLYRDGALVGSSSSLTSTFTGLTCGTSYALAVDAYDAAGNRSGKASINASTSACPAADTQPPSVPQNAQVTSTTQTSLAMSWSASTDNVGVAGYRLYRNGSIVGTTQQLSYTFGGLSCGTSYTLGVAAYDAAGNASDPTLAQTAATTAACPPTGSGGANLWVDTSGGSCVRQSSPAAYVDAQACSWNQAYQAAQTGDVIQVKGGSYGNVTIGPNDASIGSAGVTFKTASGETVNVNDFVNGAITGGAGANNVTFVGPVTAHTFRSDGTSNVTVDGWTVDCGGCDNVQIFHLEHSTNVLVKNSDISDNKNNSLIWIDGTNLTFEGNQIHDAGLPAGSTSHTECMYVWGVTNLTLKRNHFYHCSVMDVFITGSDVSNGGYVENNVFEKPWSNTGVISNSALAFHFRNGGAPSPDPNNWDFRYNTFVGPLSITTSENPVGSGGMRVIGNAFLSGAPCGQPNTTYSYNAFVSGACGTNSITNTLATYLAGFANVGDPGTYSLLATSVLRDKGNVANYPSQDLTGAPRYSGSAPDLGAYEYPG